MTRKIIEAARWFPCRTSLVAALKVILDFAGDSRDISLLMGLTGFAFRLAIHRHLSTVATKTFPWADIIPRCFERAGRKCNFMIAYEGDRNVEHVREQAVAMMIESIDLGIPALAAETHGLAEFGLFKGYDDEKEIFIQSTPAGVYSEETRDTHFEWKYLGKRSLGTVCAATVAAPLRDYDLRAAIIESLREAAEHLRPGEWRDELSTGLAAYDRWLEAFEKKEIKLFGSAEHAYNILVYGEARRHAAKYLARAAETLPERAGQLLRASDIYASVADCYDRLGEIFPARREAPLPDIKNTAEAVRLIRRAQEQESLAADILAAVSGEN